MYKVGTVALELVRTYAYEAESKTDERDGMICMELRSPNGRYSMITDADTFAALPVVDGEELNELKGTNPVS